MTISETEVKQEVERQMRIILKGALKLIGEEELREKLARSVRTGKPLNVKLGLDPSAPDIHLGHAVVLRKLKQMQDLGHQIVIIIGDFTGKIGDPTGKAKGRKALSDREVLLNAQTYQEQIFRVLDREKTQVRYNGEWLELLDLTEILKMASTVTVARMLERDDFQNRYAHNIPIGLHEFFYPLMQAYDSVAIRADLELGGSDQTFNILMGRSLQKDYGMEPQAALFMPILEGLDGVEKMSKSLGNYIGVQEEAKVMFRKVMEVPDSLITRYFALATDILPEKLDDVEKALENGENPRDWKLLLARTVTALYHSEEETRAAEEFFKQAFTKKEIPRDIPELEMTAAESTLLDTAEVLVRAGMLTSKSELRRLLMQGGVSLNGERVCDPEIPIKNGDVLKLGKKRFAKIRF
ncbi:MAG: tyrosine--tRNA ligase [Suilimivivens sp.]|mgnify:CR=1 FL=1|nr:tyrosine--tRNA ligase [Lachnospiraceae bacterium]MDY5870695.1 tyrosine--tRNA ligase [Lachnospiraceae bacterium]